MKNNLKEETMTKKYYIHSIGRNMSGHFSIWTGNFQEWQLHFTKPDWNKDFWRALNCREINLIDGLLSICLQEIDLDYSEDDYRFFTENYCEVNLFQFLWLRLNNQILS